MEWLRQRLRPYLFSNTLAPVIAASSLAVLDMLEASADLRERLHRNAAIFRSGLTAAGFELLPGEHPIIPVMLRDSALAQRMASLLTNAGSMWRRSDFRFCHADETVSAPRSRRLIAKTTLRSPSTPLRPRARNWA